MRTRLAVLILLAGCSAEHARDERSEDSNTTPEARRVAAADDDAGSATTPAADEDAAAESDEGDAAAPAATAPDAAFAPDDAGAPAGRVGAACQSDEDCADLGDGHRCLEEGDVGSAAGYCTRDCDASHADLCGAGAACVTYNGETQCQRLCADTSDCRVEDGYVCAPFLVLGLCLHPASRE